MKVLDLFCGMGGWSKPFIEDGDEVWGIDVKDFHYPGILIKEDIRALDGYGFGDMDLIIGSPPCSEFSKAKENRRTPSEGLRLVKEFERFIAEAQPRAWLMENVSQMAKFYSPKPIWTFRIGAQATRHLWGNVSIPLSPQFRFPNRILDTKRGRFYAKRRGLKPFTGQQFAEIPYPIARFIADTVKAEVFTYNSEAKS